MEMMRTLRARHDSEAYSHLKHEVMLLLLHATVMLCMISCLVFPNHVSLSKMLPFGLHHFMFRSSLEAILLLHSFFKRRVSSRILQNKPSLFILFQVALLGTLKGYSTPKWNLVCHIPQNYRSQKESFVTSPVILLKWQHSICDS